MFKVFSTRPKIFINYRRQDSSGHSGRLYDELVKIFGKISVTKDIEKIQPGEKFESIIETQIIQSDVVLVIIGNSWISLTENGKRRLDDPEDLVGKEILLAFKNKVLVIPVLVQGARMPKKEELPKELKELSDTHAIELSDSRWKYDVQRIIKRINNIYRPKRNYKLQLWVLTAIIAISLVLYFITRDKPRGNNKELINTNEKLKLGATIEDSLVAELKKRTFLMDKLFSNELFPKDINKLEYIIMGPHDNESPAALNKIDFFLLEKNMKRGYEELINDLNFRTNNKYESNAHAYKESFWIFDSLRRRSRMLNPGNNKTSGVRLSSHDSIIFFQKISPKLVRFKS